MTAPQLGSLTWLPATERPELLGAPVAAALSLLPGPAWVAEIDGELADTAAFCAAYDVPMAVSANCVVVAARRAGQTTLAACVVLATTRADVNGLVRRHLGARKASFAPQDVAVAESGMEFGGITPVGPARGLAGAHRPGGGGGGLRRHRLGHPRQQARRRGIGAGRPAGRPRCSKGSVSRWPTSRPPPPSRPGRPGRRTTATSGGGSGPESPADDDRRYLEDRPPHWGSD